MAKELAIVLNSGSIASAVTTAIAQQKHRVILVHIDDQSTPGKSTHFFELQQQHFKPYRHHRINIPFLSSIEKGEARSAHADPRSTANTTASLMEMLPIVALGLRLAIHHGAKQVFSGMRLGPESPDFPRVLEHQQIWGELMAHTCEQPELQIQSPLLDLETWQVIDLAFQISAPLDLTWSCRNQTGDPCGQCRGCAEREGAFVRGSGGSDVEGQAASRRLIVECGSWIVEAD